MIYLVNLLLFTSFNNILVRVLLRRARLQALSVKAVSRAWMSTGLTSFTTTHRMVVRVHNDTTVEVFYRAILIVRPYLKTPARGRSCLRFRL